jgi:WD40 repeat protein
VLGHQGVIHSVKWVPGKPSQLVSCSDDRSLRLWGQQQQQSLEYKQASEKWHCLWIGWGHAARIWGLGVLLQPDHPTVVVSTGEDGTARLWHGETGAELAVMRGHACQCLWSVDTNSVEGLIATGANDGTVALYDSHSILQSSGDQREGEKGHQYSVLVPDDRQKLISQLADKYEARVTDAIKKNESKDVISAEPSENTKQESSQSAPKKKKKKKPDPGQVVFGMKFYTPKYFLVATRNGCLYSMDTTTKPDPAWTCWGCWALPLDGRKDDVTVDASCGCSIACLLDSQNQQQSTATTGKELILSVAIGTTQGIIVVMKFPLTTRVSTEHGACDVTVTPTPPAPSNRTVIQAPREYRTVQGLTWLSTSGAPLSLSLLSFHINAVLWWSIPTSKSSKPSLPPLQPLFALDLTTRAIPISSAYDNDHRRLYIGDTRGNLVMFHVQNENVTTCAQQHQASDEPCNTQSLSPATVLNRIHQKEHVTDITFANQRQTSGPRRILSVGNDACIQEVFFDPETGTIQKGLSVSAPSSLTGILQVWVAPSIAQDENIMISGYYGNTFVLLNVSKGYELFRADTGGRQRLIDFCSPILTKNENGSMEATMTSPLACMAVCVHRKQDGRNEILIQTQQKRDQGVQTEDCKVLPVDLWRHHKYGLGVGLHGETIYDACFFPINSQSVSWALLTGSEDCTSRIAFYHNGTLVAAKQLPPQESCVRAVCSSSNYSCSQSRGNPSTLLAVGGGKLALQFFLVSDAAGASRSRLDADRNHVHFIGYGRTSKKATIDHRINALKAILLEDDSEACGGDVAGKAAPQHLVAAGDSEGNCFVYKVTAGLADVRHSWTGLPLPIDRASARPVLSVEIVKVRKRLLLLIGTTSGDVCLWDLPATTTCKEWDSFSPRVLREKNIVFPATKIGTYHTHQMGVNSISAAIVDSETCRVLVSSGGDDQCLSVYELVIDFDANANLMTAAKVFRAIKRKEGSSSAIKGVSILNGGFILSVGYSQRLALWKIPNAPSRGSHQEDEDLQLIWTAPASVGDINCLASARATREVGDSYVVAVGGLGLDLFSVLSCP